MSVELITAIGALLAGLGGIIGAIAGYSRTKALLELRMENVEKKLDEHNHYAEKLGDIAVTLAEIRTDIAYLKEK